MSPRVPTRIGPRLATLAAATAAAVTASVAGAGPAAAHTGAALGGAADGLVHPLAGPDHLLAMVGVGVLAVLAAGGRGVRWSVPAAFLVGMVVGGGLGLAGVELPLVEPLVAASVVACGVLVALRPRVDGAPWLLLAAVALFGAAHGHAHGAEAPEAATPALYVAGFVLATAGLHLGGTAVGHWLVDARTARLAAGGALAAAGAVLLVTG